ncbi:MAG: metal-dependent transcriptional regulator [Lentisphaeria bacterium]|nr:metal-dependent transcriptional regulator [Lentisphaeria bacterium]
MASSTVEDYLKQIYLEQQLLEGNVPSGRIAELMEVAPGTATSMLKTLEKSGLVVYKSRNGARLTENGEALAIHVLRRHRLIEQFLVEVLEYDWGEVHEEAELLEHVISEKLLGKIDHHLGYPEVDPHGDPIPSAAGILRQRELIPLAACSKGQKIKIARILNQGKKFLDYLSERELLPGAIVVVEDVDEIADAITVKTASGDSFFLGVRTAADILVQQN